LIELWLEGGKKVKQVVSRVDWNIGKEAEVVVLEKAGKFRVELTNYGATIMKILAMDRHGKLEDVVLGFENARDFEATKNPIYFGSIVGRCANRIHEGKFRLEGKDVI
jgi:aldose 1-epimerase